MRSATTLLLLSAQLFALSTAHLDWWLKGMPQCWQSCFANTGDGCSSSSCICKTSADDASYLPNAVSCAVSKCDADDWALELVLGPLQMLCYGIRCPIPQETMDEAYAAADDDAPQSTPTRAPAPTPTPTTKSKVVEHKTSKTTDDAPELTSTMRSTLTRTTTDGSGNTLQVVIPIVVGPSGIITGAMSTSTLSGKATSVRASSTPTSPPATTSLPDLTLLSSTPAGSPQRTGGSAGGNGSPFDAPGAAGRWTVPGPLLGLGALAGWYLRL